MNWLWKSIMWHKNIQTLVKSTLHKHIGSGARWSHYSLCHRNVFLSLISQDPFLYEFSNKAMKCITHDNGSIKE